MARTIKSDFSSGHTRFGNGSSGFNPILSLPDMGKFSQTSDFTIHPPNVKIDEDLKKLVARQSEKLRFKVLEHLADESDWRLDKVLQLPNGAKDSAKARLAREGKSAVISEVSKAINASSIDHSSKYLLSSEPLYVYALSYAIDQEEVNDAEGINDRILVATENKIKTYFNKLLAKKYIEDRHIDLSIDQKKQIMQAAGKARISYLQGGPAKAINEIVSRYVDYGDLNILVDKFFEAGTIDPVKGTPQIRQLMVKYLVDIGLMVSKSDLTPAGTPSGGGGTGPSGSGGAGPSGGTSPFGRKGASRGRGPDGGSPGKSESWTGPSEEKLREGGMGISGSSGENPLLKDPTTDMGKSVSVIQAGGEEASNPGTSTEKPKTSKTGK